MLAEFLTWWGQQLASLRPQRSRRLQRDVAMAALEGEALDVVVQRRGRPVALGRFTTDGAGLAGLRAALGSKRPPIVVQLPPNLVLNQSVTLPLAAEANAGRVLGYEMDRLTPFQADELFWTHSVVQRDRAHNQVHILLTLVPRGVVAPVLQAMGMAGLHPAALTGTAGQRIDLGGVGARRWQRRATYALAGACLALALAGAAVPFVEQSRHARAVERQIATLRPAVAHAEVLRRELASVSLGVDVLAAERAKVGDPLTILAALTEILPDDTVLTDLTLRQRIITMTGTSSAAARLIPALASDPGIDSPAFTAPVTRNETTHDEGFTIRAEAAP